MRLFLGYLLYQEGRNCKVHSKDCPASLWPCRGVSPLGSQRVDSVELLWGKRSLIWKKTVQARLLILPGSWWCRNAFPRSPVCRVLGTCWSGRSLLIQQHRSLPVAQHKTQTCEFSFWFFLTTAAFFLWLTPFIAQELISKRLAGWFPLWQAPFFLSDWLFSGGHPALLLRLQSLCALLAL